ncbi:MAG: phosphotransferase [Candidatus Heimdallarchaeota archaeon]|nr:phosphotransferase [Candidatus Heimdallarchaeota archaeon]
MDLSKIRTLLITKWDLANPEFAQTISCHGSDNVFFRSDGKQYIFRIIFSSPDAIHNGSQIYEYLHEQCIPTSLPLKMNDGEYVLAAPEYLPREAGYSVHHFVEGEEELDTSRYDLYLEDMTKWLARFHSALHRLNPSDLNLKGSVPNKPSLGFSDILLENIPDDDLVHEMLERWNHWNDHLDCNSLTYGFIHGDLGPGANFLLKDNKVTAIIDLINTRYGYYLEDLGTFLMYSNLYKEENREQFNLFRDLYLQYSPMNTDEFDHWPYMLLWRFLIQALYFSYRLNTGYTQGEDETGNNKGFDDAIAMLQYWKEQFL